MNLLFYNLLLFALNMISISLLMIMLNFYGLIFKNDSPGSLRTKFFVYMSPVRPFLVTIYIDGGSSS